jgi:ABC-type nitrate/sulfonate/bicarbonate transport system substrate-binding protein
MEASIACLFSVSWACHRSIAWPLEKVRLGISTRNVVLMPFYYAKDKGLFEKNGLDMEIIQIRSNLQLAGLTSGDLDFITSIGPAIEAISKGMPLKGVGVVYRAPLFSLLSKLPNAKSLEEKKYRSRASGPRVI